MTVKAINEKQTPLFLQNKSLTPFCKPDEGRGSRLTTFFEIRNSRWEITERGGQAKDCLSRPAASCRALLHLLCQNCPSLHPRGRLMQDESSLCSMTFQHNVFSSTPCIKIWRSLVNTLPAQTKVSFKSHKSCFSKYSNSWKCLYLGMTFQLQVWYYFLSLCDRMKWGHSKEKGKQNKLWTPWCNVVVWFPW